MSRRDCGFNCSWNSWAKKKNSLSLLRLKVVRNVDRAADGVAGVVEPEQVALQTVAVVLPVVGVQSFMAMPPVAGTVERGGTGLGDDADLRARRTAVFGLVGAGEDFELLDGVEG